MNHGVEHNLQAIFSLCNNPHWTTGRRWRIAELAQESLKDIKLYKRLSPQIAELDDEVEGATDE